MAEGPPVQGATPSDGLIGHEHCTPVRPTSARPPYAFSAPLRDSCCLSQEHILLCITDPEVSCDTLMPRGLTPDRHSLVLALRGLLACDVLTHGLAKRHLVDYGVNRWVTEEWVWIETERLGPDTSAQPGSTQPGQATPGGLWRQQVRSRGRWELGGLRPSYDRAGRVA